MVVDMMGGIFCTLSLAFRSEVDIIGTVSDFNIAAHCLGARLIKYVTLRYRLIIPALSCWIFWSLFLL